MFVTKLEKIDKRKYQVFLEGESIGCLYFGELKRYHLKEEEEISEAIYEEISELLYKRAKERSLYLLQRSQKTAEEVRRKLRENRYTDATIERVIDFLMRYHFIDDEQYATDFYEFKSKKYSVRVIREKLLQKGISKEIIQRVVEQAQPREEELLQKLIEKKMNGKKILEVDEKKKLVNHLLYKGFSYDKIKYALERIESENMDLF